MYSIQIKGHALCIISAILIALLIPRQSLSQNKPMNAMSVETLKLQVTALSRNSQTISSDFVQEKMMTMITEKIITRGKFFFKKEKMLRWEYTEPFSYLIIINNDQISVKDENKVNHFNVQSNKIYLEINKIILGSIQGTLLNDEKNFKSIFMENESSFIVLLKPLAPKLKESLTDVVIHFDRRDFTVSQIEMLEPGGDRTRITFSGKKFNQPMADEKFLVH